MNTLRMIWIGLIVAGLMIISQTSSLAAGKVIKTWNFDKDTEGWTVGHDCSMSVADGILHIVNSDIEPYIHGPKTAVNAPFVVKMRVKSTSAGQARLYWSVKLPSLVSSSFGEEAVVYFDVKHDGQWHDYSIPIDIDGIITQLRLDPGKGVGQFDVDSIVLETLDADSVGGAVSAKLPPVVSVANGPLNVKLDTKKHEYTITDSRTKRKWVTASAGSMRLVDIRKLSASSMQLKLVDRTQQAEYTCMVNVTKQASVQFKLFAKNLQMKISRVNYPPRLQSDLKNGAVVLTSRCNGLLIDQKDKKFPTRSFGCYNNLGLDMPWIGVTDNKTGEGVMALFETADDVYVDLRDDLEGRMWPQIRWAPSMSHFAYPRSMSWYFTDQGGYVAMAKQFRQYAKKVGLYKSLAQKAKTLPKVEWLRGAALIWGATSSEEFALQLKAAGINRAMIYGRPSAEQIRKITQLGYLTGEYDCYTDILEGEVGQGRDNIKERAYYDSQGSPAPGWRTLEGLQFYTRSSSQALRAADSYVPAILKEFPFTGRFLDVSAAVDLYEDYSPLHKFDRRQDLQYRRQLYLYMTNKGLVVGGEHGKAWNADILDYNEGMASGPFWWEMPAGYLKPPTSRSEIEANYLRYAAVYNYQVPLWELAFHDCVQSAWYWGDSSDYYYAVAPEICDRKELANMLYGTMPLMWANNLGYGWDRNRSRFIETYWKTCRLNNVLFGQELVKHEFLSADRQLQRSTFANGAVSVVNFDTKPRAYGKMMLAVNGFYVTAPGLVQSKLMVGHEAVTSVTDKTHYWVQTNSLKKVGDISVNGKLGLFKYTDNQWNVVVDSKQAATIKLTNIIPLPKQKQYRIFELKQNGQLSVELPHAVSGGMLTVPAGEGLRLYGICTLADNQVVMAPQAGMIEPNETISLSSGIANAEIRYTTDGMTPSLSSAKYTKPITCDFRVLKAALFVNGKQIGSITTGEYRRLAYVSPICKCGEPAVSATISVKGARRMSLVVDDAGDGPSNDRAIWADVKLFDNDGRMSYVSDMKPNKVAQKENLVAYNETFDKKPLGIGKDTYTKGISTHADSDIEYLVDGKYDRLEMKVGSDAVIANTGQGSIRFKVILD